MKQCDSVTVGQWDSEAIRCPPTGIYLPMGRYRFLPRFFAVPQNDDGVGGVVRNAGSFHRWQSCIGLPSRAKLALSLPIKGPSFYLPDRNGAAR